MAEIASDSKQPIPFHKPTLTGRELDYIREAVEGRKLVGDGPFSKRCAAWLEGSIGSPKVLMTPSCTAALEMAALLSSVGPGDEVIMPSFTFVSTANAVVLRGGRPVFVDIRPDTLNIDESKVEAAISKDTKAICVVHYAGVGCEMDPIMALAKERGIRVIEDAAQGVDAKYRGRGLGSIGDFGCFSFHETKNYVSGEGGAIAINNSKDFERSEIVREKGTNRSKFLRGQVDKYTWVDVGSSFLPSDISCAFLLAQLEGSAGITKQRERHYHAYKRGLADLEARERLRLPTIPSHCKSNYHIFHLTLPRSEWARGLMSYLRTEGVAASSHYVPLHSSPFGQKFFDGRAPLTVTDQVADTLMRLPLHAELTDGQVERVVGLVREFLGKI